MVAPIFTGEEEAKVARRYAAGESFYRIAKDYGCNYQAVKRAVVQHGIEVRPSPTAKKLLPEQIEEAARIYQEGGLSVSEVARRLGVAPQSLTDSFRRRGIAIRRYAARHENHGNWGGGKSLDKNTGYVKLRIQPDDPFYEMSYNGTVLEHRYVMAKMLGRPLEPHETVHHLDGSRDNNAPENLQLRSGRHGKGTSAVCCDCGSTNITFY